METNYIYPRDYLEFDGSYKMEQEYGIYLSYTTLVPFNNEDIDNYMLWNDYIYLDTP